MGEWRDSKNRLWLLSAGAAVGAAGMLVLFYRPAALVRWIHRRTHEDVHFRVETREKVVALTIDDGPHPDVTPRLLDLLAAHGVKATFFLIGERIPGNELLVSRIVAEGHELGNHLMTDTPSITLSDEEFARQLAQAHALLSQYGQVRWFRPGSGWYNRRMLDQVKRYGYKLAIGSVYPYDAQLTVTPFMTSYILGNVEPGAIIVLHDGTEKRSQTVTVLGEVLPALKQQGYRLVSLTRLAELASAS